MLLKNKIIKSKIVKIKSRLRLKVIIFHECLVAMQIDSNFLRFNSKDAHVQSIFIIPSNNNNDA